MQVQHKLEQLIEAENDYWKQCARSNWIVSGDRNTTYFHHHASQWRRANNISRIQNKNGIFVDNPEAISDVVVEFFANLFT